MKKLFALLLAVLMVLLTACTGPKPAGTEPPTGPIKEPPTAPPTDPPTDPPTAPPTDPPTDPTQAPEPNALIPEEIATLERVFSTVDYISVFPTNWYAMALTQSFDSPEEISVHRLFNDGFGFSPEEHQMTEAETEYLRQFPSFAMHMDMEVKISRIPREDVELVMLLVFGLEPGEYEIDTPSMLVYWEETDCYYNIYDGYIGSIQIDVHSAVWQEDGTIRFVYTFGSEPDLVYMEAVIEPATPGFHVLSNGRYEE